MGEIIVVRPHTAAWRRESARRAASRGTYRVDLSQVVSKYVHDTEKNLRSLFDAAERQGAVLLFDEADALFGRRADIREAGARYDDVTGCIHLTPEACADIVKEVRRRPR